MFFIWNSDTILINSTLQEIISRLEIEQQEQKDEHRKEMIELSNYIDEMREREEKKDIEMEELRLDMCNLEDAVQQQMAMKKYTELVSSVSPIFELHSPVHVVFLVIWKYCYVHHPTFFCHNWVSK